MPMLWLGIWDLFLLLSLCFFTFLLCNVCFLLSVLFQSCFFSNLVLKTLMNSSTFNIAWSLHSLGVIFIVVRECYYTKEKKLLPYWMEFAFLQGYSPCLARSFANEKLLIIIVVKLRFETIISTYCFVNAQHFCFQNFRLIVYIEF